MSALHWELFNLHTHHDIVLNLYELSPCGPLGETFLPCETTKCVLLIALKFCMLFVSVEMFFY